MGKPDHLFMSICETLVFLCVFQFQALKRIQEEMCFRGGGEEKHAFMSKSDYAAIRGYCIF